MTIKTDTITAPTYWACYLINGDSGDMTDREIREADLWAAGISPWYVVDIVKDSERFTNCYQIYNPRSNARGGGDVCDYVIHRQTRKYIRKAKA